MYDARELTVERTGQILGVSGTFTYRACLRVTVPTRPALAGGTGRIGGRVVRRRPGGGAAVAAGALPGRAGPGGRAFACKHHLQGRIQARVEEELGCTPTRYLQLLLVGMLDRPKVEEAAPELIGNLRALREDRRRRLRW